MMFIGMQEPTMIPLKGKTQNIAEVMKIHEIEGSKKCIAAVQRLLVTEGLYNRMEY